jgi:hypothetical protein
LLLSEIGLYPLGCPQDVLTYRRCVDAASDRKHVGQKFGRCGVGHQRGPAGFEVQAPRCNMVGKQLRQRGDGGRTIGLALFGNVEAGALQTDIAEQGLEGDWIAALAPELAATDRAVPVVLKPAVHLGLDDPLLSGGQEGLALSQGQAQIFGPLRDLRQDRDFLRATNGSVVSDDLKHDPDLHGTLPCARGRLKHRHQINGIYGLTTVDA